MTMAYVAAAVAIIGAGISARASYVQGKTTEKIAKNNATMAEYAAQDAQRQGEENAADAMRRAAALRSAQRVNLAANGLDLGYGTAADIQDQTDFFGQADAANARTNASRDAWRIRAGGQQEAAAGRAAREAGNLQAAGTLISAAGSVAGRWQTNTPKPAPTNKPGG